MAQVTVKVTYDDKDILAKKAMELLDSIKSVIVDRSKKVVTLQNEYAFDDLNEDSKEAFSDADTGRTHKSKNTKDLFNQLGI